MVNSGGIRAGIPKGPVTPDVVKSIVPFGNKLCLVAANGSTVRAMLEHSVEADEPQGGFLVVAGLRFWWDPAEPRLSRVVRIEVRRPCQCGAGVRRTGILGKRFLEAGGAKLHQWGR